MAGAAAAPASDRRPAEARRRTAQRRTIGLLYSFVFLYEATEGRAAKAGYPHGTLHEVRNERHTERALRRAAANFDRAWHHERHHLWPGH